MVAIITYTDIHGHDKQKAFKTKKDAHAWAQANDEKILGYCIGAIRMFKVPVYRKKLKRMM
jgi:hypothetical protein